MYVHVIHNIQAETLTVTLIWQLGNLAKITKLTYAIIDSFILQAWVFLHTVMKSANI